MDNQSEFEWVDYTKKCTECNTIKSIESFYWRTKDKKSRRSYCKECGHARSARWYSLEENKSTHILNATRRKYRNREFIHNYKVNSLCIECGEDDPIVLEFDHRDRTTKCFSICDSVHNGISLQKIREEIAKCDIRCANCHRRKTAKESGYYSYKVLYEGYKYTF